MGNGDAVSRASGFGRTRWGWGVGWVLCLQSSERGARSIACLFILTSTYLEVSCSVVVGGRNFTSPAGVRRGSSVSVVWCTLARSRMEDR
jgi:hypothetical protein